MLGFSNMRAVRTLFEAGFVIVKPSYHARAARTTGITEYFTVNHPLPNYFIRKTLGVRVSTHASAAPPSPPGPDDVFVELAQGRRVLGDSYTFDGQRVPV